MNTNKQPYQPWKASGFFGNFIGKTPANIRPFTNKDPTNTAPTGFGLPRPLKHYRLGKSNRIVNSPRGQTIRQTIDTPGGYISNAETPCESPCKGATIVGNLAPNPSLTETPQTFSQTSSFCCNAQKNAYQRVLPTSSDLKDSSINANNPSTYYSTLAQYRDNRCQTYNKRVFNFLPYRLCSPTEYYAKCTNHKVACLTSGVLNGNFARPQIAHDSREIITSSTRVPYWNFQNGVLLNNSSAWNFPIPYPNGDQSVALRIISNDVRYQIASISQMITFEVGTYTLSWYSCRRQNQTRQVDILIDTNVVFSYTPTTGSWWELFTCSFAITTCGHHLLTIRAHDDGNTGDRASAVQGFSITAVSLPGVLNGNFARPQIAPNTGQVITSTTAVENWNFQNGVLLNNSSAWNFPIPYPNGDQSVALRIISNDVRYQIASISQMITFEVGTYTLSWYSCRRQNQTRQVDILIDTNVVFSYTPTTGSWWELFTCSFAITTCGQHLLTIRAHDDGNTGDRATAVQGFSITGVKPCSVVIYNPNNPQFATQGSVKSSARTCKIKNTTIQTSEVLHNNYNAFIKKTENK